MNPTTIRINESLLDTLKANKVRGNNLGNTLDNVLSNYEKPEQLADLFHRFISNPIEVKGETKLTSMTMDPNRVAAFRQYAKRTGIPFDTIIRVAILDHYGAPKT